MPTNDELEAIMYCLLGLASSGNSTDRKYYKILHDYVGKALSVKQANRKRASKWNKENPGRHNENNRKAYHIKKGKNNGTTISINN